MKPIFLLLISLATLVAQAQEYSVKGIVVDKQTQEVLPMAKVTLQTSDTIRMVNAQTNKVMSHPVELGQVTTNEKGEFFLKAEAGKLVVNIALTGFDTLIRRVELTKQCPTVDLGKLELTSTDYQLGEAQVTALARMMTVKEDTLVFHTKALRLPPGASLATLMSQLPGISMDKNGNVTFNGKVVTQVLVDGKPFFGDVQTAMANMPTDAVKDVKLYDKTDEEKQFRGELDANKATVVDLTIKEEYKSTWMANVNLGGGTNDTYVGKVFTTNFTDHRRLAAYAQANNISENQSVDQNGNWRHFNAGNGLYTYRKAGSMLQWDNGKGYSDAGYLTSNANIHVTHNDQTAISYNTTESILGAGSALYTYGKGIRKEHDVRVNADGNLTYNWNASNRLNLSTRLNYGGSDSKYQGVASTYHERPEYADNLAESLWADNLTDATRQQATNAVRSRYTTDAEVYSASLNAKYTHLFKKEGRTFDASIDASFHDKPNESYSTVNYRYFNAAAPKPYADYRQFKDDPGSGYTVYTSIEYGEKLSKPLKLSAYYFASYSKNDDRSTLYDIYDVPLSLRPTLGDSLEFVRNVENSYHSDHYTLKNSLTLRLSGWWNKLELELLPALGIRNERLEYERGDKRFEPQRNRPYASLDTYLKYKFTKQNYIQFTYGGGTRRPDLMQLLPIIDTGNPMQEVVNNPGLKTGWDNHFSLRAYRFNTKRGDSYNGYLYFNHKTKDWISTVERDPATGYTRRSMTNVSGNYDCGFSFSTSQPLDKEHAFTLSAKTNLAYVHVKGQVGELGDALGLSTINLLMPTVSLSLRWRQDIWSVFLSTKYWGEYATYKQAPQFSQRGHTYEVNLSPQVNLPFGMSIHSNFIYYTRTGYDDALLNHDQWLINATISQSFLKDKALTLQLEAVDLLRQKTSESSNVGTGTRQFGRTETFHSYVMLHAIYKFKL